MHTSNWNYEPVFKYLKNDVIELVEDIKSRVPLIYFSTGTTGMLDQLYFSIFQDLYLAIRRGPD